MATDFKRVDSLVYAAMKAGLLALGNDVRERAKVLAPYDPDRKEPGPHLKSTGKVEASSKGDTVKISFNKPYAKRRHYENYLHPSTKLYLNDALKSVKNVSKYFKKAF